MGAAPTDAAPTTRRAARGGLANLIGAAYSGATSFVITAVITRISTTEHAGIYFSAMSIMLIAITLAQLGTPVGYVYFLARFRGLGRPDLLRPALISGALPVLALAVIAGISAVVFRVPLGGALFGADVAQGPRIVVIIATVLLVGICAESSLAATRGLGVMRPTVIADKFLNPTVQLLALLLLAVMGWTGSEELVLTRVVGFAAAALVAVPWLRALLARHPSTPDRGRWRGWRPSRARVREFWAFTGPRALGQVAQVGIQRVDIVLVALWLSPTQAAIYAAATRFLVFGQLAARSISLAIQPHISSLTARREPTALAHLYRTSTAWIMFATWPLYLTFWVHSPDLMRVFGPAYAPGAIVLQVLSGCMLVATACGAVDAVLVMAGRSDLTMVNAWIALAVNIGLNIWLIPRLGILGATLAWAATILAANALPLVQVRLTLGLHPFGRLPALAAGTCLTLFLGLPLLVRTMTTSLLATGAATLAGGILYAALVWRWRGPLGMVGILRRRGATL